MAYAWEDTRGVLVLDGPKTLSWYKHELQRILRGERPAFFRREPRMNVRQPNQTVFDCVPLADVQEFVIAVDLGLAKEKTKIETQRSLRSFDKGGAMCYYNLYEN